MRETAKITVSTLGEARFFAKHDFQDILYAVPIVRAKLDAAAALTREIRQFCVLIDSLDGAADLLKYSVEHSNFIFNIFIDIDSGYHRTGFDPSSDVVLDSIDKLVASKMNIVGLYTHGGDSYHAHGSEEAKHFAEKETKEIVQFASKLNQMLGIKLDVVAVGSTPTCSNPPEESSKTWGAGATEIHPGNCTLSRRCTLAASC